MDEKAKKIFEKYEEWNIQGAISNNTLNAEKISNLRVWRKASVEELLVILDALWEPMKKKGFPDLSSKLKLKIAENCLRLPQLPDFLTGKIGLFQFNCFLKNTDFSEYELSELWSIFHIFHPEFSNRSLEAIDTELHITELIGEKLKLFGKIKVLDLGCGKSAYSITELASKYKDKIQAYGIDFAVTGIHENVRTIKGNIKKMPFSNNSFDIIYSYKVLMYFQKDLDEVLREVYRILKVGGVFICDEGEDILKHNLTGIQAEIKKFHIYGMLVKL